MFNWDDMRYVLQVANTGSYSAAAKILEVNHTTVARRVSTLEQQIDQRLFTQTSGGLVLTEEGLSIINDIETLQTTVNCISRKLAGNDHSLSGCVKITMPDDIYKYLLANSIAKLLDDYPNIVLNMSLTDTLHDLSARESDLALRFTMSPPKDAVGVKITSLSHAIYGLDNKPVGKENSVGLVVWADEVDVPTWAESSFDLCHIALRVDNLEGMHAAVESGVGVALMPCYLPKLLPHSKVVKIIDYNMRVPNWELWILYHIDVKNSKKLQVVKECLVSALREHSFLFTDE
ncbi:LysR family transcriptional regulator [Pseudoalteromonas sp. DL2-H2.2]|uniref:LysR family transcriptional regulator n=1 Tax=Pseudoalteromonas sp. DL2-H2.2 TaxID=2908889 RepID=UPI001F3041B4|nr:LysR family transcriptional regulator [Pseudoalteromonas sp. DL2-H2.2]MCF2909354.1 LysR family transcriptional regulator [Pseudoalteromonas sp. DL2-H2.2]